MLLENCISTQLCIIITTPMMCDIYILDFFVRISMTKKVFSSLLVSSVFSICSTQLAQLSQVALQCTCLDWNLLQQLLFYVPVMQVSRFLLFSSQYVANKWIKKGDRREQQNWQPINRRLQHQRMHQSMMRPDQSPQLIHRETGSVARAPLHHHHATMHSMGW